jgi:hypothetical protein
MYRKVNVAIAILTVISAFFLFASSGEPIAPFLENTWISPTLYALSWPNTIVFNLSIGFLTSAMFWLLVVYLPEKTRRRLLRDTLSKRYSEFKHEIVQTLVWASGDSEDIRFIDDLSEDYIKFKEYFDGRDRWYAVLNGIQGSEMRMNELILAMKMFSDEVAYVLNNIAIDDPSVHRVFKRLNESIYRLGKSDSDLYDRVKHVGNFLWGILARWNLIDGQVEEDVIEKMIKRI